jgi:hypothetical protein
MGDSEIKKTSEGDLKKKSVKTSKRKPKSSSDTWKKHMVKYKKQRFRLRVITLLIVILVIVGLSLGLLYFSSPVSDENDDDNDGMPNWWEIEHGLDPRDPSDAKKDSDGDGLKNIKEFDIGTDPKNSDTDGDGIDDNYEYNERLDPTDPDSDSDGMPDGWEIKNNFNPKDPLDSVSDPDDDGVDLDNNGQIDVIEQFVNLEEFWNGTNPHNNDTDEDGMTDGWEVHYKFYCIELKNIISRYATPYYEYSYSFDPLNNTESGDDIDVNETWVLAPDGLNNLEEFKAGTDPTKPDTDGDGLNDGQEIEEGTLPLYYDTDSDTLPDGWEVKFGGAANGLDPLKEDTNNDGILDRFEDNDKDGLDNFQEFQEGTSPINIDTDDDGIPDGIDSFPLNPDPDSDIDKDGLTNIEEYLYGTDPGIFDTDGDGLSDGTEVLSGFYGEVIDGLFITGNTVNKYYTNPTNNDTDGDGLTDGEETMIGWVGALRNGVYNTAGTSIYFTNASNSDTDMDGLDDHQELFGEFGFNTNASNADSDMDKISDYDEVNEIYLYKTKPTLSDTDNDGLFDGEEIFTDFYPFHDFNTSKFGCIDSGIIDGTNPEDSDTDDDGIPDGWENKYGLITNEEGENKTILSRYDQEHGTDYINLLEKNSEIDHVWLLNPLNEVDANEDPDHDGYDSSGDGIIDGDDLFTNLEEYELKFHNEDEYTEPLNWDTDDDGMSDGWEIEFSKWHGPPYKYVPDPLKPDDGGIDLDDDGVIYYINGIKFEEDFTNLEEYQWGVDLDNDGIIDHGTTDPHRADTNTNSVNDYEDLWFDDFDNDGLVNGWELLFNGSYLDPNGFQPKDPRAGNFDPFCFDSNKNGINDTFEDPDGDGYSNLAEHGIDNVWLKSPAGSASDPTDPDNTPGNFSNRSRRGGIDTFYVSNQIRYYQETDLICIIVNIEGSHVDKKYKFINNYYSEINLNNKLIHFQLMAGHGI